MLTCSSLIYNQKWWFSKCRCKTAGWGKDQFHGNYQTIIKEVEVPVLSSYDCQSKLRKTKLGNSFTLDSDSFICAGGEAGKDACTVNDRVICIY